MTKMELHSSGPLSVILRSMWVWSLILVLAVLPAVAQVAEETGAKDGPVKLTGKFASAIVIDAGSGLILVANNANDRRQPASMLKMMTELIVLEHVADGDIKMDEIVEVSAKASNMGGSQVYLKHRETFTVWEMLMALAIHSANDAAVALAEHVAGSTEAFVDLMNIRAKNLGMEDTIFRTVHGLPPGWKQKPDITTARDMAVLAQHLIEYPEALVWASTSTAPFRDGKFTLYNPNKLVGKYRGLDGLKTGYTGPAGFCVTATAVQKEKRLISVVMGCPTDKDRATETTRLLSYGFNMYIKVPVIATAGQAIEEEVKISGGKKKTAQVAYGESLTVSIPRDREEDLEIRNQLPEKVAAPLAAGSEVGRAVVLLDGVELGSVPLVTVGEVPKGNWLNRLLN